MHKGKPLFFLSFALRALLFAVLVSGVVLTACYSAFSPSSIFILITGAASACAFGYLFFVGLSRLIVALVMKYGAKRGVNYAVIDSIGRVPSIVITATQIACFVLTWVFTKEYDAGIILLGVIAPLLALTDGLLFEPTENGRLSDALFALPFPVVFSIALILSSYLQPGYFSVIFGVSVTSGTFVIAIFLHFVYQKLFQKYGQKKIEYPLLWNTMPVDISSAFGKKEVAGCHGFLKVDGEKFVFEDGTPARFWGVNFTSAANFPEYSHSEKVAVRLARAGVNMVRFHQLDAEWSAPNIFRFAKGQRLENTRSFDEDSLDRLDYLVYCLKQNGIYIYLDFLTYRRFRIGDGVRNAALLPEAAKPYCVFDRTLIELQKEYNRNLLNHVNKYTGVAYKDEPAIALSEVVNECDLLDAEYTKITVEPYRSELIERFRAYAKENGVDNPVADIDSRTDPLLRKFLLQVQIDYAREIIDDVRKTGARFPMTAMNRESDRTVILTNGVTDFSDSHAYWRGGTQSGFMNDPMSLQETNVITRQLVTNAIDGKPFFVSEWDAPWPNEYRADVTLWTAAVGALQGWSGFTLHTYRYGTAEQDHITEKLGRSIALGGSYSRGLFDCYNDPAKMGLFYHAALLFRRGDVREADETTVYSLPESSYLSCATERHLKKVYSPRFEEWKKLRFGVSDKESKLLKKVPENVTSITQELKRNVHEGIGYIDSPRTQVVYGFCRGERQTSAMRLAIKNDFCTIAVSSLNDLPIAKTDTLLMTTVGRADNTDCRYDLFHSALKGEGRAPILADVISADVDLKTPYDDLKVWAVNNEGSLIGQLKTKYENGHLHFSVGKTFPSIYYLIQRQ